MAEAHPLAEFRKNARVSQSALAKMVGCQRWMINRIEVGARKPSPQLAARIQEHTGIDARRLLGIPAEAAE